jgi:hypothetical protein
MKKRASGPARTSAQWRKEVARAREHLRRGYLAAAVQAGLYLLPALLAGIGTPMAARGWNVVLPVAAALLVVGYLARRGWVLAAAFLLAAALAGFVVPLVEGRGLHLEMLSLVLAWFHFQAVRASLALRNRLHASALED